MMLSVEQQQFRAHVVQLVGQREETGLKNPPLAENYPEIAASLLTMEKEGVRVFYGGPLEFRPYGKEKAHLVPIEVDGLDFHAIYINCTPEDADGVPVDISYARTELLKLGDTENSEVLALREHIMGKDSAPRIVLRPSFEGCLYYPKISTSVETPTPDVVAEKISKLVRVLHLNFDTERLNREALAQMIPSFELNVESPQFFMGTPVRIESEVGPVYLYTVISPDDPWGEVQIFTAKPLEKIDKHAKIILRTDSGCDIGQLYHDRGCDCRPQLITALGLIQPAEGNLDGIVVHLPTQDGRGYGMNTKMETEGLKRGQRVIFNREDADIKPLNTVEAAIKVFGKDYDARTFDGVARILSQVGFRSVVIYTQFKEKANALREYGLTVDQRDPKDESDEFNKVHIDAKHNSERYINKRDNECMFSAHTSIMVNQINERIRHESQSV